MPAHTEDELRWLPVAPVIIALTLAGIYALGAVSIFGQFLATDLDAVQTMPLVPIDQILARGIGAIIDQALLGLLGVSLAYMISSVEDMREQKAKREGKTAASPDRTDRSEALSLSGVLGLGWPVAVLIGAFFLPFGLFTMLGAGIFAIQALIPRVRDWMRRRGHTKWRPAAFLVGYCGFLVVSAVVGGFTRPSPLPDVTLIREAGSPIRGGLIAVNGTNWFVAQADGKVVSMADGKVSDATISYSEQVEDESLFQKLRD